MKINKYMEYTDRLEEKPLTLKVGIEETALFQICFHQELNQTFCSG